LIKKCLSGYYHQSEKKKVAFLVAGSTSGGGRESRSPQGDGTGTGGTRSNEKMSKGSQNVTSWARGRD